MPELALHGSIARLLRPVLLHGAFTAVLVIGESRIQIVSRFSLLSQSSKSVMSILVALGECTGPVSSVSRNFCRWEGLIL